MQYNCSSCENEIPGTKEDVFWKNCVVDGDGMICQFMYGISTKSHPNYFLCDTCGDKYKAMCERQKDLFEKEYGWRQ